MVAISTFILILLALFVLVYMMVQAKNGTVEILSTRNMFLIGLIVFQLTGPAMSMILDARSSFYPAQIESTSIVYIFMVIVFIVFFLLSYTKSTRLIDAVIIRRRVSQLEYSPVGLMVIAISTIPIGLLCQFVLVYTPVFGPGFRLLAYGMYTIGSSLASWVWFKHFYNPIYMLLACSLILTALSLTFYQNFGRRPLVGVLVGIGWAAYYSHWRSLGLAAVIKRGAVVGGAGFVLLALVTSARDGVFREQSIVTNVSSLKDASFSAGALDLVTGQQAGVTSMWILESRPDTKEYDTLHTAVSVLTFPIPRAMWPGKPTALGISMPQQEMSISGKPNDWNIGPGLVGHIENDNPWVALWLYPIFLGVYFRLFDRIVAWFPDNPFAVLPMGSALGQFIAMPRGELGSFFFIATINVFGSFVIMYVFSIVFKGFGFTSQIQNEDLYDDEGYGSEYPTEDQYSGETYAQGSG